MKHETKRVANRNRPKPKFHTGTGTGCFTPCAVENGARGRCRFAAVQGYHFERQGTGTGPPEKSSTIEKSALALHAMEMSLAWGFSDLQL